MMEIRETKLKDYKQIYDLLESKSNERSPEKIS